MFIKENNYLAIMFLVLVLGSLWQLINITDLIGQVGEYQVGGFPSIKRSLIRQPPFNYLPWLNAN